MKKAMLGIIVFGCLSAHAEIAIECGNNVNFEDGTVGKRVFMLSGTDKNHLKAYGSQNRRIKDSTITLLKDGGIELSIVRKMSSGALIGDRFVIEDANGKNFTTAHHFMVGGFTGGHEIEKLDCAVSED